MIPDSHLIDKLKQNPELWDLFAKKEEYSPHFQDKFERFPYYLSKDRDVFDPKVSRFFIENSFKPEYPEGKKFAVCLTHDIDVAYQSSKGCMLNSIFSTIKGDFKNTLNYARYAMNKRTHPFWNFREIMALEEKYGATSSFYFLALEPGDQDYAFSLQELKDEIQYIDSKGWEVGLHGGHTAYNNYEDLIKQKQKLEETLGKKVIGYRNHYLRFKTPQTWNLLSKAGFKYDTTYGYNDCAGFRNGTCHPFRPIDLETEKEIDIIEIPLTIMDCTLLKDYMRLDFNESWELTKHLIDTVRNYNGIVTILWHNTYMQNDNFEFYENVLKYCNDKGAWMASGRDVCEWWDR